MDIWCSGSFEEGRSNVLKGQEPHQQNVKLAIKEIALLAHTTVETCGNYISDIARPAQLNNARGHQCMY